MKNETMESKLKAYIEGLHRYPYTVEQGRIAITLADGTIDDETATALAEILVQQRNFGYHDGYKQGYHDGQAGEVYKNI